MRGRVARLRRTLGLGRFFEVVDTDILGRDATEPVQEPRLAAGVAVQRLTADTPSWEKLVPPARRREAAPFFARGDTGWVASVDGGFAGWIWLSRSSHRDPWSGLQIRLAPDEAYAYALWVDPPYRPRGVGSALMSTMLREAHEDPALTVVYGWVDARNRESQALMRLSGFRPVQQVKRVHVLRRLGVQLPRSDRPRFGPVSRAGRHAERPES